MASWLGHLVPTRGRFTGLYAARNIYGTILVLALLLAVQWSSPGPFKAAGLIAVTLLAVLGAEAYSEVIGDEVELERDLTRAERGTKLRELGVMLAAAEWPVLLLLLAGVGVLDEAVAFDIAIVICIVLLFVYGFIARRLSQHDMRSSLGGAVVTGLVGVALALVKSALQH